MRAGPDCGLPLRLPRQTPTCALRRFGKLCFLGVITLFLWHAAHRLQVTLHDFGLRQDAKVAVVVYLVAAAGTVLTVLYLVRI